MDHVDFRLIIREPELAARFRQYIRKVWGDQYGAQATVARRALKEFLDREEQSESYQRTVATKV